MTSSEQSCIYPYRRRKFRRKHPKEGNWCPYTRRPSHNYEHRRHALSSFHLKWKIRNYPLKNYTRLVPSGPVILFSSTLTHSQCDAGNITFLWFLLFSMCEFFNVAVNKRINWCFVHLCNVTMHKCEREAKKSNHTKSEAHFFTLYYQNKSYNVPWTLPVALTQTSPWQVEEVESQLKHK